LCRAEKLMSSSLLRKSVLAPESSALVGIFAVRIAGLLGRLRTAVGRVQNARVADLPAIARAGLRRSESAAAAQRSRICAHACAAANFTRLFVRTGDHGDLVLLPSGQITHEARVPRACAARRVLDLVLADGWVAHRRAVKTAGKGPQLRRKRERFDEEGLPIGVSIEKELALVFGETVIEVTVFVEDHDAF
jgi:hypothetical protein